MPRFRHLLWITIFFAAALPAYAQTTKIPLTISSAKGVSHIFHVELALTPPDQERGLMFRKSMPADAGMLFVFPDEQERYFWMENTLIPLDMVFIQGDGTILSIAADARPNDLTSVPSHGPAKAVLEINGGTTAKLDLRPGDHVDAGNYFKP